jgi:predicted nucleic acid-binding protein
LILADTSVWVEHLRRGDARLTGLLEEGRVLAHPYVIGELALGNLQRRDAVLGELLSLPAATVAEPMELLEFARERRLHGRGIGYVDAALLAAVALTPGAQLWTLDRRLRAVAAELGLATG